MIAEESTRNVKKLLRDAGFTPTRTTGSHTRWQGPNRVAVTVPDGHRTISPGVLRKIHKAIAASKKPDQ